MVKTTIENAIQHYGEQSQKIVAMEEMSELIKEISKDFRGEGNVENITEEIADVYIMLFQLEKIYNINIQTIFSKIDNKLDRLEKRIEDEESREN